MSREGIIGPFLFLDTRSVSYELPFKLMVVLTRITSFKRLIRLLIRVTFINNLCQYFDPNGGRLHPLTVTAILAQHLV